jgi:hypothetical protein
MTPPDIDEALRLARARVDKGDWHEEESDTKIAAALLALDERCRVLAELAGDTLFYLSGQSIAFTSGPVRFLDLISPALVERLEAADAIATARRGGG